MLGGFYMVCKRYSAQFKINMVEEFLRQKQEQPKISIASFARDNNLSDSTFNDWVIKYKRQGQGFCNITNEILKFDDVEIIDTSPIQPLVLQEEYNVSTSPSLNLVRMKYIGAVIEFDESLLERVINILKTW